jgi:hypothetical protein
MRQIRTTFAAITWEKAIAEVRRKQPGAYLKVIALVLPREHHKVEHTNPLSSLSDEELAAMVVRESGDRSRHSPRILSPIKSGKQKGNTHAKTSYRRNWHCNGADLANGHDVGHRAARFPPCIYACVLKRLPTSQALYRLLEVAAAAAR